MIFNYQFQNLYWIRKQLLEFLISEVIFHEKSPPAFAQLTPQSSLKPSINHPYLKQWTRRWTMVATAAKAPLSS